jgi:ribosomal protein S12 methylthiotransferase accessory factor
MDQATVSVRLQSFVQNPGGLFNGIHTAHCDGDDARMTVCLTRVGDIGVLARNDEERSCAGTPQGIGAGLDIAEARVPALAEGLERYSSGAFRSDQFVVASADDLGDEALDLDCLPRCSAIELAHPKCPVKLPDKSQRIRWVRGLSLLNGRMVYLPAVMVYSGAGFATPAERFWLSISTGCAAYSSFEGAALRGIYEVIERDAIANVWLQKMSLPQIEIDRVPPSLLPYWRSCLDGPADLQYLFFNATSDLNVPTVYGLQLAPNNRRVSTLVSCSTDTTFAGAVGKVIRDMAAVRPAFRKHLPIPNRWEDFTDLLHGAAYMAAAERASVFDFLRCTQKKQYLSQLACDGGEEREALLAVVRMLRSRRMDAYVADLSTDEAIRIGMKVLRVIIPGLQPLSFRYTARFLGHARLYDAPIRMGYHSLSEQDLNPYPQPFA